MIYLRKNVGFWQFGDRLFLDVYVPPLFASIVDMHIYIYISIQILMIMTLSNFMHDDDDLFACLLLLLFYVQVISGVVNSF